MLPPSKMPYTPCHIGHAYRAYVATSLTVIVYYHWGYYITYCYISMKKTLLYTNAWQEYHIHTIRYIYHGCMAWFNGGHSAREAGYFSRHCIFIINIYHQFCITATTTIILNIIFHLAAGGKVSQYARFAILIRRLLLAIVLLSYRHTPAGWRLRVIISHFTNFRLPVYTAWPLAKYCSRSINQINLLRTTCRHCFANTSTILLISSFTLPHITH